MLFLNDDIKYNFHFLNQDTVVDSFNFDIENHIEFLSAFNYDNSFTFKEDIVKNNNENIDFNLSKPKSCIDNPFIFNEKTIFTSSNLNCLNEKKTKREQKFEIKALGRKKKNSIEGGSHNKFSDDNLSRKSKGIIIRSAFTHINNRIKKLYNYDIGDKLNKKQLFIINQGQIVSSKVKYNLEFLNKKLKDIFSANISTKYKRYSSNHNKIIIENLLNEKDPEKRDVFQRLFNLTFYDCLKHFRGEEYIQELDGMITLDEACKQFKGQEYYQFYEKEFKNFILNYENIIGQKKSRNKIKKI